MALLWLGGCTQVWAVPALQEVKVNPLLADQLLLELSFSEPVSGFTDRLTYEPNQLLLHVPRAIGALTVNPLPIKQQGVNNLLVEGKGRGSTSRSPSISSPPIRSISRAINCWWRWEIRPGSRSPPRRRLLQPVSLRSSEASR